MANSALWSDGSSAFNEQASVTPTLSVSLEPISLWSTGNLALFMASRVVAVTLTSDSPVNILYSTNGGATFSSFATNATSGAVTRSISLNIGTYNLVFKVEGEDSEYTGYKVVVSRLVILGSGQSNMAGEGQGAAESLYTHPNGSTSWLLGMNDVAQPMKNQWSDNTDQVDDFITPPNNTGNAWMIFLANKLVAEYSEPVICVPAARGGTTIAEWQKDATEMRGDTVPAGQNNLYNASLRRFNVVGGATLNLLQLGENDALYTNNTTTESYKNGVIRYAGDVKSDMGLDTIIIALHTLTGSNWSGNGATTGQNGIRSGQIEAANEDDNIFITEPTTVLGATGGDGVHITNPAQMDGLADIALAALTSYIEGEEPVNQPPTANAGPNQSVEAGARVQLNATLSTDPEDGSISQFGWEQVDNGADAVFLEFANTATPEFTAPSSLTAQTLEFRVQAQDSEGATSTDTVIVNVASLEENAILSTMETLDFELVTQGNLVAYKGRANREVMQLKPSSTSGIVTAGGYLDVSNNGIVKVEIIADGKKISNENSDSIKIDGARILARLGDLDIPTSGRASITPTFMIVLYVGSDTRGLVVASNATSGYKTLSYRVEDAA